MVKKRISKAERICATQRMFKPSRPIVISGSGEEIMRKFKEIFPEKPLRIIDDLFEVAKQIYSKYEVPFFLGSEDFKRMYDLPIPASVDLREDLEIAQQLGIELQRTKMAINAEQWKPALIYLAHAVLRYSEIRDLSYKLNYIRGVGVMENSRKGGEELRKIRAGENKNLEENVVAEFDNLKAKNSRISDHQIYQKLGEKYECSFQTVRRAHKKLS